MYLAAQWSLLHGHSVSSTFGWNHSAANVLEWIKMKRIEIPSKATIYYKPVLCRKKNKKTVSIFSTTTCFGSHFCITHVYLQCDYLVIKAVNGLVQSAHNNKYVPVSVLKSLPEGPQSELKKQLPIDVFVMLVVVVVAQIDGPSV